MFGDIGHGAVLWLFATSIVLLPGVFTKAGLGALVKARYLLFLMGMFATYCGICYNDFMSIPIEGAESCYEVEGKRAELEEGCAYPIGLDPKWYMAHNELTYFNSMKMKIAVILGVSQMCLGILVKAMNAIYFKRTLDLVFEFIP